MKFKFLLAILLFSFTLAQSQTTVHINSDLGVDFLTFIDGQLQFFGATSNLKIIKVPKGKKTLQLHIQTPSNQTPSIQMNNSERKEYYTIGISKEDKYYLKKVDEETALKNGTNFNFAAFVRKPKPKKLDSGYVQPHSCKVKDSIFNARILQMGDLDNLDSKINFVFSSYGRNCLTTEQIRSIGYRIDDDKSRFDIYKKFYITSLDRVNYGILAKTFDTQIYESKFRTWFSQQKK